LSSQNQCFSFTYHFLRFEILKLVKLGNWILFKIA